MSVRLTDLERKYRDDPDPWQFRTSPYEQEKFAATREALSRETYGSGIELGCGNGALAEYLAPLCTNYVGIDGVESAVIAARQAVPNARFVRCMFPCSLPVGKHDLIILSEILYFLDDADIGELARQISQNWPRAEIICVTYLGETAHVLQGEEAFDAFLRALGPAFQFINMKTTSGYRIDRRIWQEQHR